jgi:hypothetical protein
MLRPSISTVHAGKNPTAHPNLVSRSPITSLRTHGSGVLACGRRPRHRRLPERAQVRPRVLAQIRLSRSPAVLKTRQLLLLRRVQPRGPVFPRPHEDQKAAVNTQMRSRGWCLVRVPHALDRPRWQEKGLAGHGGASDALSMDAPSADGRAAVDSPGRPGRLSSRDRRDPWNAYTVAETCVADLVGRPLSPLRRRWLRECW